MQIIEKKLYFQVKEVVEVDKMQTNFIANCSVNFENLTYKADPVITTQHGDSEQFLDTVTEVARVSISECVKRLDAYREKMGLGKQGQIFSQPTEPQPTAAA